RLSEGDVLDVDLRELAENAKKIEFPRVLLVSGEGKTKVGTPLIEGAKVVAEVVASELKGPKLHIFHLRRRKASRTKTGHRQKYMRVRVSKIVA
ncbi:MAG: 50S ribosomal protein L21, partial [Planctomycetota bacterium]